MEISKFIAFYPSRPFWAVSQIDFDFQQCPVDLEGEKHKEFYAKNVLELFNILPSEIFKKIDKARKIRNDIVHSLEIPLAEKNAELVMQTAKEMIKHLWKLHFEFNPGYSIRAL